MLLSLLLSAQLSCSYTFQTVPFATVQIGILENGMPESSAMISSGPAAPAHKETVTPAPLANGEYLHVWLSKENPDNTVEMIIYNPPHAEGQSVLINNNVPLGKEVWGSCSGVPFGYL
jgi:hypothetical protein